MAVQTIQPIRKGGSAMNSLEGVMVVGLTGQTGAGKTTVCSVFERCGFTVINADQVARRVVEKGSPCLRELSECFPGDVILLPSGELNRARLAELVFTDPKKLELLNSISYPYITGEILKQIRLCSITGRKLILLDAPTLFESRADDFCELIISVIAKEPNRLSRIMERDNLSEEQAKNRMNSQHTEVFFRQHSDFIIKNNKTPAHLQAVTQEVADKVREYYNTNYANHV